MRLDYRTTSDVNLFGAVEIIRLVLAGNARLTRKGETGRGHDA
jgi:hypothetical protein